MTPVLGILALSLGVARLRDVAAPSGARAVEAALRARGGLPSSAPLYVPCACEAAPAACTVVAGALPADFPAGWLLRVGPNPDPVEHAARRGTAGFLDGDGMVHAVAFHPPPSASAAEARPAAPSAAARRATYARRWVATEGRAAERARGSPLAASGFYDGTLGSAPYGWPLLGAMARNMMRFGRATKDTCNTALALHGGTLLALMEQGLPAELELGADGDVHTRRAGSDLGGAIPPDPLTGGALSAHGRACGVTGERYTVTYGTTWPYARLDVFPAAADGPVASVRLGGLRVPCMLHDLELTSPGLSRPAQESGGTPPPESGRPASASPGHVLVFDLPLTLRPRRLLSNRFPVQYEPAGTARVGFVRRGDGGTGLAAGGDEGVAWATVAPCVVLHSVRAVETGCAPSADGGGRTTTVVWTAVRSVPPAGASFVSSYTPAFLHEWTFEVEARADGTVRAACVAERALNEEVPIEFPTARAATVGDLGGGERGGKGDGGGDGGGRAVGSHAYAMAVVAADDGLVEYASPRDALLFDGFVKMALDDGDGARAQKGGSAAGDVVGRYRLAEGEWAVSEPTLVPRVRAEGGDAASDGDGDDDGYVLLLVTRVREGGGRLGSALHVVDSRALDAGPVAVVALPDGESVPYGLHSLWVPWDEAPMRG
jgi:carotenoid cleavage dioxygenase